MPILASFTSGPLKVYGLINKRTRISTISYLVVAGGGSTGLTNDGYSWNQGGAGGGGFLTGVANVSTGLILSVTVGGGGSYGSGGSNSYIRSSDDASLNVESAGGGAGGIYHVYIGYFAPMPGGSGGGSQGGDGTGPSAGAAGYPPQGNKGGDAVLSPGYGRNRGGGGGAGSAGGNGSTSPAPTGSSGSGGSGLASPISGTPVTYARGGSAIDPYPGTRPDGTAGSGNGADVFYHLGGSGIVFIKASNNSVGSYTGSPTLTSSGDGNTVFKFSGSGTITFT